MHIKAANLLLALTLLVAGVIATRFAVHEDLSSFADDSVSYLIMGQVLSPWSEASAPVRAAYPEQAYPPLFPALLGLSGTAYSLRAAHLLVVGCLVIAAVLLYRLATLELESSALGLAMTMLFLVSPAVWMNLLGILSENLYLLFTMAALLAERSFRHNPGSRGARVVLGALLAATVLTRSIGVTLLMAFCALGMMRSLRRGGAPGPWVGPAVGATALVVLGYWLWPGALSEHYLSIWGRVWGRTVAGAHPEVPLLAYAGPQLRALHHAWYTSWLIYWVHILDPRYLVVTVFGLLALCGLVVRARAGRLDAWYVGLYLVVLALWPAPGQMTRFLYPVLPLAVLHAVHALRVLLARLTVAPQRGTLAAVLALALLVAPSVGFIYQRAQIPGYARVTEFYRRPDLARARAEAAEQRAMLDDMRRIRASTPSEARVLWFTPAYIALLAQRHGGRLPWRGDAEALLDAARESEADYVYLSRLNPRMTGDDFNGLTLLPYLQGWTKTLWAHRSSENGRLVSVLLRVERDRLAAQEPPS